MLDTVLEYDGVGWLAPQVHHSIRLVLLCLDPEEGFEAWINPCIDTHNQEEMVTTEGCLSVPVCAETCLDPANQGRSLRSSGTRFRADPSMDFPPLWRNMNAITWMVCCTSIRSTPKPCPSSRISAIRHFRDRSIDRNQRNNEFFRAIFGMDADSKINTRAAVH